MLWQHLLTISVECYITTFLKPKNYIMIYRFLGLKVMHLIKSINLDTGTLQVSDRNILLIMI